MVFHPRWLAGRFGFDGSLIAIIFGLIPCPSLPSRIVRLPADLWCIYSYRELEISLTFFDRHSLLESFGGKGSTLVEYNFEDTIIMKIRISTFACLSFCSVALAAQCKWCQCGGLYWQGGKTCIKGTTCQCQNPCKTLLFSSFDTNTSGWEREEAYEDYRLLSMPTSWTELIEANLSFR